jgi:ADP-ribose pyrophosphatase YjhB (NUDIX family)
MNHDHFMMHEESDFQFCPVCGGRLESTILKKNEPARLVCSDCDFIFYLDPKLAAGSVVELDGRIVLLRRGIEPQKGKWVVPGGYVDRGEAVEAAALRETEEECGIRTRIKNLLGIYSYPGRPVVVVVYVTEYLKGDLAAGDEALEVKLFRLEEIPWDDLAFPSTADALRDYCSIRNVSC